PTSPPAARLRAHTTFSPRAHLKTNTKDEVGGQTAGGAHHTIHDVPRLEGGHFALTERPTGCTVVVVDGDAVGGVSQRGGAPGTRETDLLNPLNMVDKVNAIVLAGGSAFGLEAATGTVRWLEEHNIGWPAGVSKVPLVPAGILFDLSVADNHEG